MLNSGGANACTGHEGFQTAHATAEKVAEVLGAGAIEVAVCSTGLIGAQLPRGRVLAGVEQANAALAADAGGRTGRGHRDHDDRHRGQAGRAQRPGRAGASAG